MSFLTSVLSISDSTSSPTSTAAAAVAVSTTINERVIAYYDDTDIYTLMRDMAARKSSSSAPHPSPLSPSPFSTFYHKKVRPLFHHWNRRHNDFPPPFSFVDYRDGDGDGDGNGIASSLRRAAPTFRPPLGWNTGGRSRQQEYIYRAQQHLRAELARVYLRMLEEARLLEAAHVGFISFERMDEVRQVAGRMVRDLVVLEEMVGVVERLHGREG